jgi:hypothetical protein
MPIVLKVYQLHLLLWDFLWKYQKYHVAMKETTYPFQSNDGCAQYFLHLSPPPQKKKISLNHKLLGFNNEKYIWQTLVTT